MNKKVLLTMIFLLWVFLFSFSIIKLFFGEWFVAVVENEKIIMVGSFIDQYKIVTIIADILVGILSSHFYFCSCKQSWKLSKFEYIIIFLRSVILAIGYSYFPSVTMWTDLATLIIIPLITRAKLSQTVTIFCLHQLGQLLTLFIRSEPLYLASTNYATQFFLLFDVYVWLALYYLYSNFYKEETLWENLRSRFSAIRRKRNSRKNF